jgi:DNA-binding NtrC family response regulator
MESTAPQRAPRRFLIVEDDPLVRSSMRRFLEQNGDAVIEAESVEEAHKSLRGARPDAAVLDYQLPDGDGLSILRALKASDPTLPVIILTAYASIDLAVQAVKEGAEQFLSKPVELPALLLLLDRAIENRRLRQAKLAERSRAARQSVDPFVGESTAIRKLAEQARRLTTVSAVVLLQGESGSGKGVLARWIHDQGPRGAETFVDLNCAGLAKELLESELFGHRKGAFTGAVADKAGLFEIAHRGTLFLDEIGDADLQVQPRLLKVLEEQRFRPVGDVRDRSVDVRLMAASHVDLRRLVEEQRFRDDLYYRISAIPLFVPPLRERGADVILLARSLLERLGAGLGFPGIRLSPSAERTLSAYYWPGNIRELRNVLERAVLLGDRMQVDADDLADVLAPPGGARSRTASTLDEAEREHIRRVLQELGGEVRAAAAVLGLSRSALYRKLQKHGLPTDGSAPSA